MFNISYDVLLYNLTSTYFEADPPFPERDKRRFGYSRDHRVQIVIALVVTPLKAEAAKKSRKRHEARSPAPAITAGTASEIVSVDVVTGVAISTTAGTLRPSPLTATPLYR